MNLKKSLALLTLLVSSFTLHAQLTKSFTITSPQDQAFIDIGGTKSNTFTISWSDGKASSVPFGTNYYYDLFFDTLGGDLISPIASRTTTCCQSAYQGNSFVYTMDEWAGFLNSISNLSKGKKFLVGDTLKLKLMLNLTAIDPAPTYEFRQSDSITINFIRTQFEDEYVPFSLNYPAMNLYVNVGGDQNTTVAFDWQATYCPSGCGAAEYTLLIDTIESDFSYPYQTISVPFNANTWSLNYNTLNQILVDSKTPEDGTKTIYWTVMASGGAKTIFAKNVHKLHLINKLLNNENHPYYLVNPPNNTTVTLKGAGSTQLNYKWESTFTPLSNQPDYSVVFDTAFASPIFGAPLMHYQSKNNGIDTSINLTYGSLVHKIDSIYGKGWKKVTLMWAAKALAGGSYFYPEYPYSITFIESYITSVDGLDHAKLEIYPNPTQTESLIRRSDFSGTLRLLSLDGKVLNEYSFENEKYLDTRHLKPGVYLLQLSNDSQYLTRKIVVQH